VFRIASTARPSRTAAVSRPRPSLVRLGCAMALAAATALPTPLRAQPPLAPGATLDGSLQPGERQTFVVSLDTDACAHLELRTELALSVSVRRPDGTTTIVMDEASRELAPQPATLVAHSAGQHIIELRLPEAEKPGSYQLELRSVGPATTSDRQAERGEALFREGLRLFTQTARESRRRPTLCRRRREA